MATVFLARSAFAEGGKLARSRSIRLEFRDSIRGRCPVRPSSRFYKIQSAILGKAVRPAVCREVISIKARQTFTRDEPEIAARISDDRVDGVARQAIDDAVRPDGKTFGGR